MKHKLESLLLESFDFSIEIILLCKKLNELSHVFYVKSLFQTASHMGVNLTEAVEFQVNRTFLIKLNKAAGDAKETLYWLKRIEKDVATNIDAQTCIEHCENILRQINMAFMPSVLNNVRQ